MSAGRTKDTTSPTTSIKEKGEEMASRVSNLDEREQKNNKVLFLEPAPLERKKKSEISCPHNVANTANNCMQKEPSPENQKIKRSSVVPSSSGTPHCPIKSKVFKRVFKFLYFFCHSPYLTQHMYAELTLTLAVRPLSPHVFLLLFLPSPFVRGLRILQALAQMSHPP